MTLSEIIPYIFSASMISLVLAAFSIFVDMLNLTNLEIKLMPLKKYLKNMLIVIIIVGVGLSVAIQIIMIFSGEKNLYTKVENIVTIKIENIITSLIITIFIILIMLVVTAIVYSVSLIFAIKPEYSIQDNQGKWTIIKVTSKGQFYLRNIAEDNKRRYKTINVTGEEIIEENICVDGRMKFIKEKFLWIIIGSILVTIVCVSLLIFCKAFKDTGIAITLIFIIFVSVAIFISSIGFKINTKLLNLDFN